MSARANHAKTARRRDINRETEKRRVGEWANLARSPVLPFANDPLLRVIDHPHELAENVFVRVIDCLEFGVTDVAVTKCKLDVHLRFGGFAFGIAQLGNESRGVAPFAPRLCNICADRARRTTNLIGKRISLVVGKFLAQLVNT